MARQASHRKRRLPCAGACRARAPQASLAVTRGVRYSASLSASMAVSIEATPGGVVLCTACCAHVCLSAAYSTSCESKYEIQSGCSACLAAQAAWRGPPHMSSLYNTAPDAKSRTTAQHPFVAQRSATMRSVLPLLATSVMSTLTRSVRPPSVANSHPSAASRTSTTSLARIPQNCTASASSWMAMFFSRPSEHLEKHSPRLARV
mmetsp:Transcript_20986/g.71079  ORF Transcript_20986/g.71079 Transcript_20986/m.71079 type:complete len:205 (-) Transcript_20986:585-1199(-)